MQQRPGATRARAIFHAQLPADLQGELPGNAQAEAGALIQIETLGQAGAGIADLRAGRAPSGQG